jgi:NAD(P)H-dependent FMN reductase
MCDFKPDAPIKILAFCGSLREKSLNRMALDAMTLRAPFGVEITIFDQLEYLPFFNPDIELAIEEKRMTSSELSQDTIQLLSKLKSDLAASDALIISSPEYAHGVTGLIKNTLDWLVSGESFVNLPVMLVNTSARATHAQASLLEIVKTMSANVIEETNLTLPLLGSQITSSSQLLETDLVVHIDASLILFCNNVLALKSS